MAELRTRARFPEIPADAGHYESFYLKTAHPSAQLAAWIRYTVHKRPSEPARGSLWFTLFRGGSSEGPLAVKATLGPEALGVGDDHYIHVGDSRFEPGRVVGSAAAGGQEASWMLEFDTSEPPFRHLPREWMYRASIPRTKLLSPYPNARFRGYVKLGERRVGVDDWPGMVGHNWGSQHAERWIWTQGAAFEGKGGGTWLDAALGRVKVGPLTTPWIGNGVLCLDGERHRLGGAERMRSTEVSERPDGCELVLPGKGMKVRLSVGSDRGNFVGWVYSDPDGSQHNTVNCSIAQMRVTVERPGASALELHTASGAAYELGMRETDHGIPIQPYADP
jgi:hypothetical protein